jgi:uncharacterized protein (UPF0332 family)
VKESEALRLAKAQQALEGARRDLAAGEAGLAADRAYYAMFHAADALLSGRGRGFRSHGAVHGAFGKEFAKSGLIDPKYHRWLLDAFRLRQEMVYDVHATPDREAATEVIRRAAEFIEAAASYLRKSH